MSDRRFVKLVDLDMGKDGVRYVIGLDSEGLLWLGKLAIRSSHPNAEKTACVDWSQIESRFSEETVR